MVVINALTGLKRKRTRYETQRNKRETACSTVAGRMYGQQAMEAFAIYLKKILHKKLRKYPTIKLKALRFFFRSLFA